MMDSFSLAKVVEAVFLGVVQGIAEFLPISSSGHLVIVGAILDEFRDQSATRGEALEMNVALHFGTLLSILVVYRNDLLALFKQPRICLAVVIASVPAAIAGFTLKDTIETAFEAPLYAGCGLLVTSVLLLAGQRLERNDRPLEQITYANAALVGIFQAAALVPGISRSGSTIAAGLMTGLQRQAAAAFSFFMAIPVIGGATLLTAKDVLEGQGSGVSLVPIAAGTLTAFIVGMLTLTWLLRLIAKGKLHWFAVYTAIVGVLTIAWQLAAGA